MILSVLGCKDGRLISKALEYGTLAPRSKHKKSLLGKGLWYINECQKLFQPLSQIRYQFLHNVIPLFVPDEASIVLKCFFSRVINLSCTLSMLLMPENDRKALICFYLELSLTVMPWCSINVEVKIPFLTIFGE